MNNKATAATCYKKLSQLLLYFTVLDTTLYHYYHLDDLALCCPPSKNDYIFLISPQNIANSATY